MTGHEAYAAAAAFDLQRPGGDRLLLLLHGLGGDRQQALGMVAGFSQAGVAVLAPDLRAHGETPVIGGEDAFTFDALVDDILALLRRLGQDRKPAYVAGVSMGAALALRLALDGRLDVRAVAMVRPAFDDKPYPANLAALPLVARLLRTSTAVEAEAELIASPEYRAIATVSEAGARSVREQLEKPLALERAVRLEVVPGNVAYRDPSELQRIDIPVLVIGADRDPMHPIAMARDLGGMIPRAELEVVTPRDIDAGAYERQIADAVRAHVLRVLAPGG
jgi:pimeloyl-ACP methyl ester carboxylesterase